MPQIALGIPSHDVLPGVSTADHHVQTVETVHPGVTLDNTIARYTGIAGALQAYISLPPTITDAGIMEIPAGTIIWPDAVIVNDDLNALHDVQKGQFTPVMEDNSGAGSATYNTDGQVGQFQKIGRVCTFQLWLDVNSTGDLGGTEQMRIGGMPFTCVNITNARAALVAAGMTSLVLGANTVVQPEIRNNEARIALEKFDLQSGNSIITIDQFSDGGRLHISGSYEVEE